MADLTDVEDALVTCVAGILYPDGTDQPSAVAADCRIYRGWPTPSGLNADLAAGVLNVTVFPSAHPGRTVLPLPIVYPVAATPSTFSVAVTGNTLTFTGTPTTTNCVGALIDRKSYAYRPQTGDTAAAVAAQLALLISQDRVATLSGTSVTIPQASKVVGRVVADKSVLREVRRQEREVVIACWCPSPALRDAVASKVDTGLAAVFFTSLADGTSGRISYNDTLEYDQAQNAMLYRRDLMYLVEYPTVILENDPSMLFGDLYTDSVETLA